MNDDRAARELLRHALAALAYRAARVLRDAPPGFGSFGAGTGTRTAGEIVAHLGDLVEWAAGLAAGRHVWSPQPPGDWDADCERFLDGVRRLDEILAGDAELGGSVARLLQGPVADALTHVGQLALLRRLAGSPVAGESYYKADIAAGRWPAPLSGRDWTAG